MTPGKKGDVGKHFNRAKGLRPMCITEGGTQGGRGVKIVQICVTSFSSGMIFVLISLALIMPLFPDITPSKNPDLN